ncbi:hypothetical protein AWV80_09045 [Cupriavidus sp. UYMU48A]|nr:hypothetical protein AWV80_09045 [Cupriavidus sp. UYMU48A]
MQQQRDRNDELSHELVTMKGAAPQCHVPKGWKLVPVKATAEMKAACRVAGKVHVWDDMIAAAPTTPAAGPDDARAAK